MKRNNFRSEIYVYLPHQTLYIYPKYSSEHKQKFPRYRFIISCFDSVECSSQIEALALSRFVYAIIIDNTHFRGMTFI